MAENDRYRVRDSNTPKPPVPARGQGLDVRTDSGASTTGEVTLSDRIRKSIRRDCQSAMVELLGSGCVPDYYQQAAGDFVMIAEACWREGYEQGRGASVKPVHPRQTDGTVEAHLVEAHGLRATYSDGPRRDSLLVQHNTLHWPINECSGHDHES